MNFGMGIQIEGSHGLCLFNKDDMNIPEWLDRDLIGFDNSDVERQTLAEFENLALQFRRMTNVLRRCLELVLVPHEPNDRFLVTMALLHEAHRSLVAAYSLWNRGYYQQSVTVGRSVHESWLTCMWLQDHEDSATLWLEPDKYKSLPTFKAMADALPNSNWTDVAKDIYRWTSERAHPRYDAIFDSLLREGHSGEFHIDPAYKGDVAWDVALHLAALYVFIPLPLIPYLPEHLSSTEGDECRETAIFVQDNITEWLQNQRVEAGE